MLLRTALPGLLLAAALAAAALLVPGPASPLTVSLLAGVAVAAVAALPDSFAPGPRVAATGVMRLGVVLLGLSVTSQAVMALGWPVLLLVLGSVGATLLVVVRRGVLLGVRAPAALLVAAGFAICGTSAVQAIAPLTGARREEVAYAVGPVTLCGTLSVAVLRVSLLAVLVSVLAVVRHDAGPQGHLRGLPPFVLSFLVAAGLSAGGLVPAAVLDLAAPARTPLLAGGTPLAANAVLA